MRCAVRSRLFPGIGATIRPIVPGEGGISTHGTCFVGQVTVWITLSTSIDLSPPCLRESTASRVDDDDEELDHEQHGTTPDRGSRNWRGARTQLQDGCPGPETVTSRPRTQTGARVSAAIVGSALKRAISVFSAA